MKGKGIKLLLTSVAAIVTNFTMLLGTTYAWFTDASLSDVNVIQSGNIDVAVEYTLNGEDWNSLDGAKNLFQKGLWEPGHTEVVALKISNKGSLAVKYLTSIDVLKETFGTNKNGEKFRLSEALTVSTLTQQCGTIGDIALMLAFNSENGVAYEQTTSFNEVSSLFSDKELLSGDSHYLFIKVDMASDVSEKFNHNGIDVPSIEFGVKVLATQFTYENDTFGNQYDKDASYKDVEYIVDFGTAGGTKWTLGDKGTLTILPTNEPFADSISGKEFKEGCWKEAVIYDSNGNAKAIGGYPYDVNEVKSLVIADGVTSIGSFTAKFPNITGEVVIPASVNYIGQEAFQNCEKITKLTFAKGGTEKLCIAPGAFKKLGVEEVVFPEDRPEIHIHCWAFNDCANLKRITFPANVTTFSKWTHVDYMGMDYVNSWDSQILARCNKLETITFGSEEVKNLFFNAAGNSSNVNAIGNVNIVIEGN